MTNNINFVKSLPITTLPLSKLVTDYLLSKKELSDCYQSFFTPLEDLLAVRLQETQHHRSFIATVFEAQIDTIPLSATQKHSLELFIHNNAAVVVTGQQAAVLGGPFYTFSKIADTIVRAKKASEVLNHPVIPVFWLEDNDHDAIEAGIAHWFDENYDVEDVYYAKKRENNTIISEMKLDKSVEQFLEQLLKEKKFPTTKEQIEILKSFHHSGQSVADSFHKFIATSFQEFGLLILRSSDVRKLGGYVQILTKEFENPSTSFAAVQSTTQRVLALGYEQQVQIQMVQAFYHEGSKRRKVSLNAHGQFTFHSRTVSQEEFKDLFQTNATCFSPSALLRLVSQDVLLPSLEVVMGPGELSYAAQTLQLYQLHSITQPKYIFRKHCVALFDSKVEKMVHRDKKPLEWLFVDSTIHQQELFEELNKEYNVSEKYEEIQKQMAHKLNVLSSTYILNDSSMKGHFESVKSKMNRLLLKSEKKVMSSVKRQNMLKLDKISINSKLIRPNGRQQERYICSAYYGIIYGIEEISKLLVDAFNKYDQGLLILPSINPK